MIPATRTFAAFAAAVALAALTTLTACTPGPQAEARPHQTMDLDSLHRDSERQDSVESNVHFYELAFDAYKVKYPGVDKPAFMAIAKGKDQDFCLFKPDAARTCLEVADKFNDLGLKQPARDAYEAGLLSEGANDGKVNIRLWASMAQIHFDEKEYDLGKPFLLKVLEVEPKNKWAKKLLATAPKTAAQ